MSYTVNQLCLSFLQHIPTKCFMNADKTMHAINISELLVNGVFDSTVQTRNSANSSG